MSVFLSKVVILYGKSSKAKVTNIFYWKRPQYVFMEKTKPSDHPPFSPSSPPHRHRVIKNDTSLIPNASYNISGSSHESSSSQFKLLPSFNFKIFFLFFFFFFLFLCQNDVRDTRAPSFKLFDGRFWGLILHWSRAPWLELDSLLELDSGSMLTREMVLLLLWKSFPVTQRLLVLRLSFEFGLKDYYNVHCNSFS